MIQQRLGHIRAICGHGMGELDDGVQPIRNICGPSMEIIWDKLWDKLWSIYGLDIWVTNYLQWQKKAKLKTNKIKYESNLHNKEMLLVTMIIILHCNNNNNNNNDDDNDG